MCATGTLKDVCTSCDFLPSSVSILNFIINEECVGQMMVKALGCFALKALSVTTLAVCFVKITKYEYYLNYIYVIVCKLCRRRLFETKSSISHNCSLASVLSQLHLPSISSAPLERSKTALHWNYAGHLSDCYLSHLQVCRGLQEFFYSINSGVDCRTAYKQILGKVHGF